MDQAIRPNVRSTWVRALSGLLVALLVTLGSPPPSRADTYVDLSGIGFSGTLVNAGPTSALIATPQGLVLVPSGPFVYTVGGRDLALGALAGLAAGTDVRVMFAAAAAGAVLRTIYGGTADILLPGGSAIALPLAYVPRNIRAKTRVLMPLPNGNVVNVPLNAQLNKAWGFGNRGLPTRWSPGTAVRFPGADVIIKGKGNKHHHHHHGRRR